MDAKEIHIMHCIIPQDSSLSVFMIRSSISHHIFIRWPFLELYKHFHFTDNLNWFFFFFFVHHATVVRPLLLLFYFSILSFAFRSEHLEHSSYFFMVIIANWCTTATTTTTNNEWVEWRTSTLSYSRPTNIWTIWWQLKRQTETETQSHKMR